ncbi:MULTISPECIES: hypothetical protein [unclassified Nostoc]|uniref:hypothetical protein n=1 Tax=unclassified Nostoc TaxID=2593658 RepID=UPI002AD53791|nr:MULTISPECIES: hypothetical protein [unclassified Nostoc]MDZ8226007.1 hypothetical protein [Nostoc sp. ChiVER01]
MTFLDSLEQKNTGSQFYAIAVEILSSIIGICHTRRRNFRFYKEKFYLLESRLF